MQLVDTHCHIHEAILQAENGTETSSRWQKAESNPDDMLAVAAQEGVTKVICVGTTVPDSKLAVEFAQKRDGVWASIGMHPHEGSVYVHDHHALQQFRDLADKPKVVAVGETGLDYYYEHSTPDQQKKLLRFQLDLAAEHDLPLIFHIRDAFEDFWPIFDEYKGLRGVVHSFTGTQANLDDILKRNLFVGLNGIMTFTKNAEQLEVAKRVPAENLLLETDAPFLTPVPFRGKICEPRHVKVTATFLSDLRGESLEDLAVSSTRNASRLFNI